MSTEYNENRVTTGQLIVAMFLIALLIFIVSFTIITGGVGVFDIILIAVLTPMLPKTFSQIKRYITQDNDEGIQYCSKDEHIVLGDSNVCLCGEVDGDGNEISPSKPSEDSQESLDDLSDDDKLMVITEVAAPFNESIRLGDILAPKLDEYDIVLSDHDNLIADLKEMDKELSRYKQSDFVKTIRSMVNVTLEISEAQSSRWYKLKMKAKRTRKYSISEYNKDTKKIDVLINERAKIGGKVNRLREEIAVKMFQK